MADEEAQEKTEDPTERRLEEAREQGQIVRSKELNTMVLIFGGVITMYATSGYVAGNFYAIFVKGFSFAREYAFDPKLMLLQLNVLTTKGLLAGLPFLLVITLVALLAPIMVGGFNFSMASVSLKWDRLNFISGLQKMFSLKSVGEFVKAVLKFSLVTLFVYIIFYNKITAVFLMDKEPVNVAIHNAADILLFAALMLSFSLVIIALVDVPLQVWNHAKELKMTKQEVRDDLKNSEGKPEIKRKIREKQNELRKRRMMSKIPTANVVITNPTHFAIAIKYDEATMSAPVVVAKGADLIAEMIRKVAKANNLPFVSAPPLARALYYNVDLDEEIPSGLYVAVARVLAYVYELNLYNNGEGNEPTQPLDFAIPKELRTD